MDMYINRYVWQFDSGVMASRHVPLSASPSFELRAGLDDPLFLFESSHLLGHHDAHGAHGPHAGY